MPDTLYFEDFPLGEVVEYGGVDVSAADIIAFACEFDPQPFHTDEEAARAAMGGLVVFISILGGIAAFGLLGVVLGPIIVASAASLLELYAPTAPVGNRASRAGGK